MKNLLARSAARRRTQLQPDRATRAQCGWRRPDAPAAARCLLIASTVHPTHLQAFSCCNRARRSSVATHRSLPGARVPRGAAAPCADRVGRAQARTDRDIGTTPAGMSSLGDILKTLVTEYGKTPLRLKVRAVLHDRAPSSPGGLNRLNCSRMARDADLHRPYSRGARLTRVPMRRAADLGRVPAPCAPHSRRPGAGAGCVQCAPASPLTCVQCVPAGLVTCVQSAPPLLGAGPCVPNLSPACPTSLPRAQSLPRAPSLCPACPTSPRVWHPMPPGIPALASCSVLTCCWWDHSRSTPSWRGSCAV